MSLDVYLYDGPTSESRQLYDANITHNLGKMAAEAGIYQHLWRPEELGITVASELIAPLTDGLDLMKRNPARFEPFNAPNGWGKYEDFVPWIERYLEACVANPTARVEVSR